MEFYNRVFQGVRERQFVHPKLEKLKEYLLDHFRRNNAAGRDTRVIVFAEYRSSVQEILNYLRGAELIRATAFVGQQKKSTDILAAERGRRGRRRRLPALRRARRAPAQEDHLLLLRAN